MLAVIEKNHFEVGTQRIKKSSFPRNTQNITNLCPYGHTGDKRVNSAFAS